MDRSGYKRNRYALLSDEERARYIQNSKDARKKRRIAANNFVAEGENSSQSDAINGKRQRIRWLFRAQLVQYESKGSKKTSMYQIYVIIS